MSILDHPLIAERYFFPRKDRFDDPYWVDCGEARLACYYHKRLPGARTIVHFHGNGETVADYIDNLALILEGMGCNCFLAEYRGYGMSTGTPALGGMLKDVRTIIKAIGEPEERLVLFGRSVGSIYAIHGASRFPRIAGLIIESGIADPLDRILFRVQPGELGATPEAIQAAVAESLDHKKKIFDFHGASLIMHARYDGLLDVSHAERLHEWARRPKTLKIFERGDHNSIMYVNYQEYFQQVGDFLDSF